ncbi:MAG: pilus assembly protein TadG-related protein [Terracidiphilus sp.]|jgi:Flp pilus assembly protein TadG
MKLQKVSCFRKLLKDTHGQTAIVMALSMVAFIGMAGIAIDLGHGYAAVQLLQASTNAAALAGAAALPNTTTATSQVTAYSAMAGEKSANPSLTDVTVTPTFKCLTSLTTNLGLGCATATGTPSGNYNAVQVTQTAQVALSFGAIFHIPAFNISATATASMSGGQNTPWNVAIILDATSSMTSNDSGLQCTGTQESCALQGVQAMLQLMYPCASGQTCTGTSITPVDTVSLFVFPPVLTSQAKDYYTCPTTIPTIEPYEFQNVTTGTVSNGLLNLPVTSTYQVVPTPLGTTGNTIATFAHDYKLTDTSASLNAGSQSVIAAGGKSGCTGLQAKGGEGTYYAQAIYAAQAALVAQQAANPGSQNAMIILGDGDMQASSGLKSDSGTLNGTGSGSNKSSYAYPSALGQCGQAIIAAQSAAVTPNANGAKGTRVYTVGYGAKTSGTCSTDATYSAYKGVQACTTLQDIASSPGYFYSDDANGCKSPNQMNFTQLKQIFQAISRDLTTPRLVPNSTT